METAPTLEWPPRGPPLILRNALLDRLAACEQRLILIDAAAGYGKSTLLRQWEAYERRMGRVIARATIRTRDAQRDHFIATLTVALTTANGSTQVLPSGSSISDDQFVQWLCEFIEESDESWLLLLDDFHLALSSETIDLTIAILDRAPETLRVALACRGRPPLPLGRMLAQGELLEIGPDALRLDKRDVDALFEGRISDAEAAALARKTEGWAIALQMARVLVSQNEDPSPFLREFNGSDQNISHYLSSQVFDSLSIECRQFLVDTCCLDRICEDLADAVRNRKDSWRFLEELGSIRAFFMPCEDVAQRWYRHHPMFGEYLDRLFARLGEEEREALHRRAAHWHSTQGLVIEAIGHARQTADLALVEAVLDRAGGASIGLREGTAVLRQILTILPDEWIYKSPPILLARSVLLAKDGRLLDARRCVEEAHRLVVGKPRPAIQRDLLFADLLIRTYLDLSTRIEDAEQIHALLSDVPLSNRWFRGWINNFLCMLYMRIGDLAASHSTALSAADHYRDAGALYTLFFVKLHSGFACAGRGQLGAAYAAYREALRLARTCFPADASMPAIANILIAELFWQRGHVARAESLLEKSLPQVQAREGWTEIYATGYMTAAAIAFHRHGLAAALRFIEAAEEMADLRGLPRLRTLAFAKRIELLARAGRTEEARAAAEESGLLHFARTPLAPPNTWLEHDATRIAFAMLALASNAPADALHFVQQVDEGSALVRASDRFQALLIAARAQMLGGDDRRAGILLAEALTDPSAQSCRGIVDAERVNLTEVIEACRRRARSGEEEARRCLDRIGRSRLLAPGERNGLPGGLTERETQMLSQIVMGRTNKMIARDFNLTERTIKFHLQNLYSKLGASNRIEATYFARSAGLA